MALIQKLITVNF
ncbi:hypothetical protein FWK35_00026660 [Aphis craccivora]|uniref:Uncharacterized protein n=1 Tax=Aphis craccivora TaxID=307492 RepID=A0A6G0Y0T3_APHCR|nr:hypothetical protein FWK35_00026660 [Aphis craccivora]